MKILILGGSGMLGHQLYREFSRDHEVWVTLRREVGEFSGHGLFGEGRVLAGVEAMDFASVERALRTTQPAVVLNCVGIIKQLKEATDPIPSLTINSLLPHRLARLCGEIGARLVHFSTDCVFSGRRGGYRETDTSDAEDLYGRTKYLGEVGSAPDVLTLRSSIIGRELGTAHSLVDWFLSQRGKEVRGYRRAIYTGFTTLEMARIVRMMIKRQPALGGLWQVASAPIDKYELLLLLRDAFGVPVEIRPYDDFVCDRSLDGGRFSAATGYQSPAWRTMIEEMASAARSRP
jgi:dTDP-4-dehydrorhamnose reductase